MQSIKWFAGSLLLLLVPIESPGQVPGNLEFEVASLRPSPPRESRDERPINGRIIGGPGTTNPGRIIFSRVPLDQIIAYAFGLTWSQVSGPDWTITVRYDIVANVPPGATEPEAKQMLQRLLASRLHLVFHQRRETMVGYELVTAATGPKLKESGARQNDSFAGTLSDALVAGDNGYPILPPGVRQGTLPGRSQFSWFSTFRATSMSEFAFFLGGPLGFEPAPGPLPGSRRTLPTPVVDRTGLTGNYDFTFDYEGLPGFLYDAPSSPPHLSSIQTSLAKLGLTLVKAKVAIDVLVIDRIEKMPTEN